MSAFIQAMDAHAASQRVPTTNGVLQVALQVPGSIAGLASLFVETCRGADPAVLGPKLAAALAAPDAQITHLAIVFLVHLRDVRGGKGERDLFFDLFPQVVRSFPATALALVSLMPMYGRYKDLADVWVRTQPFVGQPAFDAVRTKLVQTFADALRADAEELTRRSLTLGAPRPLSLAAKWLPGSKRKANSVCTPYHAFRRAVRDALYGSIPHASVRLRKLVSACNRALRTTETLMSTGQWPELDPSKIPSGAVHKYRQAMLYADRRTGEPRGADPTRLALRRRVLAAASAGSLHAGTLDAHQLVCKFMYTPVTASEAAVLNGQWTDLVATVRSQLAAADRPALDLGNVVAMVDVSPSMDGTPMEVAIALGLLVSDLAADPFKHRVLTFESTPAWVATSQPTLDHKVSALRRASWGGSTNFLAAFDLILQSLETAICSAGRWIDPPTFITFSDMQFDRAQTDRGAWATTYETMTQRFEDLVRRVRARHIPVPPETGMPVQIFWNLASTVTGLATSTDQKGVILLSGYNQNLLKLVLRGQLPAAESTPEDVFTAAMMDPRYDPVRQLLAETKEGVFAAYQGPSVSGLDEEIQVAE